MYEEKIFPLFHEWQTVDIFPKPNEIIEFFDPIDGQLRSTEIFFPYERGIKTNTQEIAPFAVAEKVKQILSRCSEKKIEVQSYIVIRITTNNLSQMEYPTWELSLRIQGEVDPIVVSVSVSVK